MKTSRPTVDRLLDSKNRSVTLSTLERAAPAVGKKLTIGLTWPGERSGIHLDFGRDRGSAIPFLRQP